jgi:acetylornithine aminotransferase
MVSHVRGRGLLLAAVLAQPNSADLERALRDQGLIVNAVAPDAIRMAPPLVITDADLAEALDRWDAACATVAKAAA